MRKRFLQVSAGGTHFSIGLDSENAVPILQQKPREDSSTGSDVSNGVFCPQTAIVAQGVEHLGRILGSIADVVVNAVSKAFSKRSVGDLGIEDIVLRIAELQIYHGDTEARRKQKILAADLR